MPFFSIFDLLVNEATKKCMTVDEMLIHFKKKGINKRQILQMKDTAYYSANPEVFSVILDFLNMSKLELDLFLGKIPPEYRAAYYSNISRIAQMIEKGRLPTSQPQEISPVFKNKLGSLYHGDCVEVMKTISDDSVNLIFADPPFNLDKEYDEGVDDNLSMTRYLNWSYEWIDQCIRILKPGGYLFIYNLPKWCTYLSSYLNQYLTFWHWIAIDMKYRLPISRKLYPAHYALIAYVKGNSPEVFNNQRTPLQTCRHCGGDIKDYGGYKSKMNPLGVNVSDVWTDIYPVRHKSTKNRKFNELSIKLLDRVISLGTNEGDLILDPFGGSGTTYAVAQLLNRKWIGCEIGDCKVISDRILNPENDKTLLDKIYKDKNILFTEASLKLREKNGFWISR